MKKTLIALAALAATAGVAHAQSSVTLYGVVDAYVGVNEVKQNGPGTTSTKLSQGVVNGSGLSSSRWGMRGSEDLGGGLAAVFTLESGFSIDTGAMANNNGSGSNASSVLFGREASVGMKGAFGEARLGRQYTAYDALRGATNNTYDSNTFATTSTIWNNGVQDYSNRVNNAVSYKSPVFGGFSAAVAYGFGEDKTATTSASSSTSFHVKYANGPLLVGYGYQREKSTIGSTLFSGVQAIGGATNGLAGGTAGAAATFADTRKYNLFGAAYDFGVAKITGSYNTAKGAVAPGVNGKDKEFQVGVSAPFGAAALAAGYSRSKSEFLNTSTKATGYSLLGTYDLSKRTTLYAGYINQKAESVLTAGREDRRQLYATGVRHTF